MDIQTMIIRTHPVTQDWGEDLVTKVIALAKTLDYAGDFVVEAVEDGILIRPAVAVKTKQQLTLEEMLKTYDPAIHSGAFV